MSESILRCFAGFRQKLSLNNHTIAKIFILTLILYELLYVLFLFNPSVHRLDLILKSLKAHTKCLNELDDWTQYSTVA